MFGTVRAGGRLHSLVVGALAGMTSSLLSYPFDVLRTRLVANNQMQSMTITREVRDIWKLEGLPGFFKGSIASMATITATASITFGVYETIKIYCDENENTATTTAGKKWKLSALNHSAGTIGGVVAKISTFPLETVRRRMQFMNSKHLERFSKHSDVYGLLQRVRIRKNRPTDTETRGGNLALQRHPSGPVEDNTHHLREFLGVRNGHALPTAVLTLKPVPPIHTQSQSHNLYTESYIHHHEQV